MRRPGAKAIVFAVIVILVLSLLAYGILNDSRRVAGTSMLPTLEQGDLVVIQSVPSNAISIGDIIVYNPPCATSDFSVIHRVVAFSGNGFITKGDNNGATDQSSGIANGPVTANCIAGKVVFVIPYVERLASLPYGANYALAALIIIFVIASELRSSGDGAPKSPSVPPAV